MPVRGGGRGGSQPLPRWSMASIVALKIDEKSGPECPFEYGGGAKAIWAMPKYLRVNCNGASLSYGLLSAINKLAEMVCILSSGQK